MRGAEGKRRAALSPAPAAAAFPPPRDAGRGRTVLFIDASETIRRVARAVLEKEGYRVFEAADAEEGIVVAAREGEGIDVIVSDIDWPGMDGLEVLDAIRKEHPALPFVFISAAQLDLHYLAAIEREGINFVAKPFSARQLLKGVARQLRLFWA
jgi:CheY-like chemotaxis protein